MTERMYILYYLSNSMHMSSKLKILSHLGNQLVHYVQQNEHTLQFQLNRMSLYIEVQLYNFTRNLIIPVVI